MENLFMKLVEMSISASWVVLAVLVLRLLLKRSPRWIHVALWAMVALRLIFPLSLKSALSLNPTEWTDRIVEDLPNSYVGSSSSYWDHMPEYEEAVEAGAEPIYAGEGHYYVITGKDHLTPVLTTQQIAGWIWVACAAGMLVYAMFSYRRVKKQVDASLDLGNGVFLCDYIDTPFILGIFGPKIYLPSRMDPDAASHVLAHERAHIARKDHWWKPFGYVLLSVYWFNPLLWLAYILLCRDIELACDEKVIRNMEVSQKKAYSEALLNCSVNRRMIAACPLAFGEVGVKERVKTVLNYRKPTFWIVLVAVLALIVTGVCFLTEPVQRSDYQAMEWFGNYAYEQVRDRMDREDVLCIDAREGYALVYCRGQGPTLTLYRYEKQGKDIVILDSCAGEYAISGGMSLNHLEDQGKHIYFGTASEYHWNPKAEVNTWIVWNHLTLTDAEGKSHKKDMLTNLKGFLFILDAPIKDFSVVDCLDTECLNLKKFTEQGYYMAEAVYESQKGEPESIPYAWTSTVENWNIQKCWAYQAEPDSLSTVIERDALEKLIRLLNDVKQEEIISRGILGPDDPIWDYEAPSVNILCTDGTNIRLRYVYDTVIIMADTEFALWDTNGYWTIENDALKQWMYALSLGGTEMLSEANRQEIRDLLRQDNVSFFDPQKYEDLLFVGCWYDGGRGMAIACYEPLADGYVLRKLIRGTDIKTCGSGEDLYFCDYGDLRIFMILNQSITGMEFAGGYRLTRNIDTHPGLAVVYYPENLNAMYRFHYGSGATTMYMDRQGNTHGVAATIESADLPSAHVWCSIIRKHNVETVEVSVKKSLGTDTFAMPELAVDQLLRLLNSLPEAAFSAAPLPEKEKIRVEISCSGLEEHNMSEINAVLSLKDDTLYYTLQEADAGEDRTWSISSHALREFIQSLGEDGKTWWNELPITGAVGIGADFHRYVVEQMDGIEISIPEFDCFSYAVSESGIRFKPLDQEGWILVQYRTEPFAVCGTGLETCDVSYKNGKYTGILGFYDGSSVWSFVDVKTTSGDIAFETVLLNEGNAAWVTEYHYEITQLISEMTFRVIG